MWYIKEVPRPRLILNPSAGKGHAGKIFPKVQSLLGAKGFEYDLRVTEAFGHAIELSRQAAEEGCDLVIAAGGDGTSNEVINGLMLADLQGHERPALGILPIGRGNDFAYGVGVPLKLEAACQNLIEGKRRKIDLGYVVGGNYPQGRYFGNGIGLGFDAVVGFEAAKIRRISGMLSYLVAVFKTISLYSHAPIYQIDFGEKSLRQPFLMVSVMNGRRMGGAFMMAPHSHPDDRVFDLCLAGQVSQATILRLIPSFIRGTQASHPAVEMAKAQHIRIQAVEGTIPAHADGETLCTTGQELVIDLRPAALEVIVHFEGSQP